MAGFDFRSVGWVLAGTPQGTGRGSAGAPPAAPGARSATHAPNLSTSGRTSAATCPSCALAASLGRVTVTPPAHAG
jgi:hypothetical protein